MAFSSRTASRTVLPIGPAVSCVLDNGRMPERLSIPTVGLIPTIDPRLPGLRMDPEVSVPTDTVQKLQATATADPALEPPVGVEIL
ncbi:hypothetical protein D3C75_1233710 [compost metagenome]